MGEHRRGTRQLPCTQKRKEEVIVQYFRYHALRHAGASLIDNINTPIGTIQKILGHENRRTTEIYLHSFNETEKQAIRDYELARRNPHTDSHTTKKALNPTTS